MSEYFSQKEPLNRDFFILRHDVDRRIGTALRMAELEHSHGVRSTYFFRRSMVKDSPEIIKQVSDFGHEVGLHYECLDCAKGDVSTAVKVLGDDLAAFRSVCPVTSLSMHGNPLTKFDNRDIWLSHGRGEFGLVGEAYMDVDFSNLLYYSDTGRTFSDTCFNLFDHVPEGKGKVEDQPEISSTSDLIDLLSKDGRGFYVLIHPNRWSAGRLEWILDSFWDCCVNYSKLLFKKAYSLR